MNQDQKTIAEKAIRFLEEEHHFGAAKIFRDLLNAPLPEVVVQLPDGDAREIKYWFREMHDEKLVVSITVGAVDAGKPDGWVTKPLLFTKFDPRPHRALYLQEHADEVQRIEELRNYKFEGQVAYEIKPFRFLS